MSRHTLKDRLIPTRTVEEAFSTTTMTSQGHVTPSMTSPFDSP